jgi:hypothetical protein
MAAIKDEHSPILAAVTVCAFGLGLLIYVVGDHLRSSRRCPNCGYAEEEESFPTEPPGGASPA